MCANIKHTFVILTFLVSIVSVYSQQTSYSSVEPYTNQSFGEKYTNDDPYFNILIPNGIELYEAINQNSIIVYDGGNDYSRYQIRITDLYTITNGRTAGYTRRQFSYNLYSKESKKAAYDGRIRSTLSSLPNRNKTNIEHSIKRLGKNIFIYLKFDYNDDNNNPTTRISYSFLNNGYDITIVGYVQKDYSQQRVINFLNSFSY
jgi:hypothetical protein